MQLDGTLSSLGPWEVEEEIEEEEEEQNGSTSARAASASRYKMKEKAKPRPWTATAGAPTKKKKKPRKTARSRLDKARDMDELIRQNSLAGKLPDEILQSLEELKSPNPRDAQTKPTAPWEEEEESADDERVASGPGKDHDSDQDSSQESGKESGSGSEEASESDESDASSSETQQENSEDDQDDDQDDDDDEEDEDDEDEDESESDTSPARTMNALGALDLETGCVDCENVASGACLATTPDAARAVPASDVATRAASTTPHEPEHTDVPGTASPTLSPTKLNSMKGKPLSEPECMSSSTVAAAHSPPEEQPLQLLAQSSAGSPALDGSTSAVGRQGDCTPRVLQREGEDEPQGDELRDPKDRCRYGDGEEGSAGSETSAARKEAEDAAAEEVERRRRASLPPRVVGAVERQAGVLRAAIGRIRDRHQAGIKPALGGGQQAVGGGAETPVEAADANTIGGSKKGAKKAVGNYNVKLVKTLQHAVRCSCAVAGHVWAADRQGHIDIRTLPKQELVASVPSEGGNLVWCMASVGSEVWVGQEIGPIVVYSCKPPYKRLRVQPWHVGGVTCLTVKSGGASVWSGSNDFGIAKWTAIGDKVASYCAHTNGVRCMLSLGPHLWSGADDATVRVWDGDNDDTENGECVAILRGHQGSVISLAVAGKGVWSGSSDGSIREWNVAGGRECLRQVTNVDRISHLVPIGDTVWTCGMEPSISVWDSKTMRLVEKLKGHTGFVNSLVKVERTETLILWSGSLADKTLRVWRHRLTSDEPDIAEVKASKAVYEDQCAVLQSALLNSRRQMSAMEATALDVECAAVSQIQLLAEDRETLAMLSESQAEKILRLERELAASRQSEADLKSENETLSKDMVALRDELLKRNKENAALVNEKKSMQQEINSLLAQLQAALAAKDAAEARIRELLDGIRNGDQTQSKLQDQITNLMAQLGVLRADFEKEKEKNLAHCNHVTALLARIQNLESNLAAALKERDRALAAEEEMRLKYSQLDIFKLDMIARELKKLDQSLGLIRDEARAHGADAKKMTNFRDQAVIAEYSNQSTEKMGDCKTHVRNIIEQCFSELQKMHIGVAATEEGLVAEKRALDEGKRPVHAT